MFEYIYMFGYIDIFDQCLNIFIYIFWYVNIFDQSLNIFICLYILTRLIKIYILIYFIKIFINLDVITYLIQVKIYLYIQHIWLRYLYSTELYKRLLMHGTNYKARSQLRKSSAFETVVFFLFSLSRMYKKKAWLILPNFPFFWFSV